MFLRGYFTFLIVFAAFALLISLAELNLNSKTHNLSSAITTEKFYRIQMNVKEVIVESARQGAQQGFDAYAATHTEAACMESPNHPACFKSRDAQESADNAALLKIEMVLASADFGDAAVVLNPGTNPVNSKVEPAPTLSGWRLASFELSKTSDMSFTVASEEQPSLSTTVKIPKITVSMDESTSYP